MVVWQQLSGADAQGYTTTACSFCHYCVREPRFVPMRNHHSLVFSVNPHGRTSFAQVTPRESYHAKFSDVLEQQSDVIQNLETCSEWSTNEI